MSPTRLLLILTLLVLFLSSIVVAQKVHVKTYRRKDGTVVRAHNRNARGTANKSQSRPRPATQPNSSEPTNRPRQDERPFDANTSKLPAGFVGEDIRQIYSELAKREARASKDEFETDAQFKQRAAQENVQPILGHIPLDSVLAFKVVNRSAEHFYDADTQTMTTALVLKTGIGSDKAHRHNQSVTSWTTVAEDKYQASNAFGAAATVTRLSAIDYRIGFANGEDFRPVKYSGEDAVLLQGQMDVEKAKRLKPYLAILAIVRLKPPFTYSGFDHMKPTIDKPTELYVKYYFLNSELLELWLYDPQTGEVFQKKRATR